MKIAIFYLTILLIFTCSCEQQDDVALSLINQQPQYSHMSLEAEANALELSISEFNQMDSIAKLRRKAALQLLPYLRLENNQYYLDISEEGAINLGKSGQYCEYSIFLQI